MFYVKLPYRIDIDKIDALLAEAKESFILQSLIDDVLVTLWLILDRCAVAGIIL